MLAASVAIAESIAAKAIRQAGRCTWVGAVPAGSAPAPAGRPAYATIGPDLYGGTSGVALVLAEVATAAGRDDLAAVSLEAMQHALDHRGELADTPLGLYAGLAGLVHATAAVGAALDDRRLQGETKTIVRELAAAPRSRFDIVSGAAGAIVALLALREELGPPAMTVARELGDLHVGAARAEGDGLWWPDPDAPGQRGLTGLAHGAAGIGWALHELAAASGEGGYRDAGDRAFAYERRWMRADGSNWLDLRGVSRRHRPDRAALAAGLAWCHGAPGILLTRLRSAAITGAAEHRTEAQAALATTRVAVADQLAAGAPGTSLCHGLAGNAAILSAAAARLGGQPGDQALVDAAARTLAGGRDRLLEPDADTPGLMLGEAGVARFLVGRARPERHLPFPDS
jgi:lantibiotic modifying enzyme